MLTGGALNVSAFRGRFAAPENMYIYIYRYVYVYVYVCVYVYIYINIYIYFFIGESTMRRDDLMSSDMRRCHRHATRRAL